MWVWPGRAELCCWPWGRSGWKSWDGERKNVSGWSSWDYRSGAERSSSRSSWPTQYHPSSGTDANHPFAHHEPPSIVRATRLDFGASVAQGLLWRTLYTEELLWLTQPWILAPGKGSGGGDEIASNKTSQHYSPPRRSRDRRSENTPKSSEQYSPEHLLIKCHASAPKSGNFGQT